MGNFLQTCANVQNFAKVIRAVVFREGSGPVVPPNHYASAAAEPEVTLSKMWKVKQNKVQGSWLKLKTPKATFRWYLQYWQSTRLTRYLYCQVKQEKGASPTSTFLLFHLLHPPCSPFAPRWSRRKEQALRARTWQPVLLPPTILWPPKHLLHRQTLRSVSGWYWISAGIGWSIGYLYFPILAITGELFNYDIGV